MIKYLCLSIAILIALPLDAHAYNCERIPLMLGEERKLNLQSDLVFSGKVIHQSEPTLQKIIGFAQPKITKKQINTFKIEDIWHGDYDEAQIKIVEPLKGGGGCPYGYGFETEQEYLVFAKKSGAEFHASAFGCVCSASSPLNSQQAQSDLQILKKYKNKEQ